MEPITVSCDSQIRDEFTLVFTGLSRSASEVLREVPRDPNNKLTRLRKIRNQADNAEQFLNEGELSKLGILGLARLGTRREEFLQGYLVMR